MLSAHVLLSFRTWCADSVMSVQTRCQKSKEDLPEPKTKLEKREIKFDAETFDTQEFIALQRSDPKLKVFYVFHNCP